jgi:hypothetical protein
MEDNDSPYVTCTSESDVDTSFTNTPYTTDTENEEQSTPEWYCKWSEDECIELEYSVYELMDDYLYNDIQHMSKPNFMENMINDITNVLYTQFIECKLCKELDYEDIKYYVSELCGLFFETNPNIPARSYKNPPPCSPKTPNEIEKIESQIIKLKNMHQAKQRTREWYESRHNIITASNLWKVFSTELQLNSLIYEKCKPLEFSANETHYNVNTLSATHWGNKYEPVTVMIYESMFSTKVEEFGCIIHSKYSYIGASPDGINCIKSSPLYGRMLEIKNIVNREITGIPKEEYWIQTQIQMETCELDTCDFMETRFKEYATPEDFYYSEFMHEYRGVILYFIEKQSLQNPTPSSNPYYVYMPLSYSLEKENIEEWIAKTREELKPTHIMYETLYWYLDEYSCVLIKRNRDWFNSSIGKIQEVWNIIQKEKVEGYEHRMPKKKMVQRLEVTHEENTTNQVIRNLPENTKKVCLIKLNEDGSIV